jgi:2-iminoacetate synthase ThiH
MARNKLSDLNDHLFEQLERLSDEDLTEEQLEKEIKRAKAVSGIAKILIDSGGLATKKLDELYAELEEFYTGKKPNSTKPKQLEKFHAEGTE